MDRKQLMLIVDDLKMNRQLLEESFHDEYEIIHASNGAEAMKQIENHADRLAIVLLDIVMPDVTGIDILKWMSVTPYQSIPVIAITAESHYQLEAIENGAWDFIAKPAENSIIKARVKNVLSRNALNRAQEHNKILSKSKLQIDNLVNSIPGGIAIYKITDRFETIYFSEGVAKLSGYTAEEYKTVIQRDAADIVYKEDKERIMKSVLSSIHNHEAVDETYRIYHKDGGLIWVHLDGAVIDKQGDAVILHAVFQRPPRMAQLYDNLVNESRNTIYVSDINNYDLLYVNKTGLQVLDKEAADYSRKKCYEFLFGRNEPCKFCRISEMNPQSFLQRDFFYPLNQKTYSLRGKLIDWNGLSAHVEYIEDITEAREIQQRKENWTNQLQLAMDNIPGGMCVYRADASGIYPIVHNQAFFNIFGYSPQHQQDVINNTRFLNVHPDDLAELEAIVHSSLQTNLKFSHTYRSFHDLKNRYVWINMNAVIVPQISGDKLCYVSYTDVTQEREAQENLIQAQQSLEQLRKQAQDALENYQSLVNAVPGGIAQFEIKGTNIAAKYFSDGLCSLTGHSRAEIEKNRKQDILSYTYKEDLPALSAAINHAVKEKQNLNITYRLNTKSGPPCWVHLSAAYSSGINGECLYQAVFTNVDKLKKIEQELKDNQLRYEVAIKSSGINIWEYDIQKDSLYVVSNSSRIKQNCFHIENYIKSTLANGFVREDSIDRFLSIFVRLKQGTKEITEDIWYKTTDEAGWWCERVTYTTTFDHTGKPIKAYGAGRDVTREKEAEQRFHEEISYRKAIQSDTLSSLIVDLTDNKVLEITSAFNCVLNLTGSTADNYFEATANRITGKDYLKEFYTSFSRQKLLSRFGSGEFALSMQFTCLYDTNTVYWVNYNVHLIQNPETHNIIAHISCIDITAEKVMQTIMETVSKTDYDFFVVVDGSTDSAKDYAVADGIRLYDEKKSFEEQNENWIRSCVCAEDLEHVLEECKINTVWSHIKDGKPYKFTFSMITQSGEIRRKQLQFTAISPERKTYLMSRIDVNNIYQEQELAKNKLEKALAAKSDFLSNMSHDMRTPMNAIIGFSQMAMDEHASEEVLHNYVSKINHSGHYLLNLINDVLDMAKIDSNKIELHPEPVDSEELFDAIISSIKPMIDQKQIEFVFKTVNFIEHKAAVVDKLRIQQIFINLLSNAIKFTPVGGKIDCIIESMEFDGTFSKERTIIRDNGCGMSEEFLQKAFVPFEQEYSNSTGAHSGTGLGLSIVKSLVELMGGTIKLYSTPGIGTQVVLEFTTKLVDKSPLKALESLASIQTTDLYGKRILLCEDHPLNCEIASRLLIKKGCLVEVANDGTKGLALFKSSAENFYDAILMDIRMPILDGLQVSRAIRSLDRFDAKTVPIIAMTANAFDDDVKKSIDAGMNAHLAKPIEPERLYQTLSEFLSDTEGFHK